MTKPLAVADGVLAKAANYRMEIDGLRAFAVVAVIIHHFDASALPSGFLGVDIFFVISGFVITASLVRHGSTGLGDFLLQFYTRRIKRLAPALIAYAGILGLLICLFDENPIGSLRTGAASLFGLSNIYLLKQSSDYFGSASELNAFTHTWSVGVEEQFYLLFPLLVWFSGYGRQAAKAAPKLAAAVAVMAAASLVAYVFIFRINQPLAFFSMPTRLWELGTGCILFLCSSRLPQVSLALKRIPPLPVTAALAALLFAPLKFAAAATISTVVLTALLLASIQPRGLCYSILTSRPAVYLGRISYSLYLWHWGVIVLSRWTVGIHWWTIGVQVAVMLTMAVASYHLIEVPFRRAVWSVRRGLSISYGVAASLLVATGLVFLQAKGSEMLFAGNRVTQYAHPDPDEDIAPEDGAAGKNGTLLLIGDSHAGHLTELGRQVANELGMEYRLVSQGATPFLTIDFSTPAGGLTYARTQAAGEQMRREVEAAISSLPREKRHLIVLSSFYRYYFDIPAGSRKYQVVSHFDSNGARSSRRDSLRRWLTELETFGKAHSWLSIALILSTPEMPGIYPLELCTAQWYRPWLDDRCFKSVPLSQVRDELATLNSEIAGAASRAGNILVFDPLKSLCPGGECPSHMGDSRLYSDEDHLTPDGARRIAVDFIRFLRMHGFPR